jgi:hypothetical protein
MFEFTPPRRDEKLNEMMDRLISGETLIYDNGKTARNLGKYAKVLRNKKNPLLHLSYDRGSGECIAYLKLNNKINPGSITKYRKRGKPVYRFKDTLLPKIDLF